MVQFPQSRQTPIESQPSGEFGGAITHEIEEAEESREETDIVEEEDGGEDSDSFPHRI